jgi:hypothetical protein
MQRFVAFARPFATLDKVAFTGTNRLVDVATVPDDDKFAPGQEAYFATAGRPANRSLLRLLLENGLQRPEGVEGESATTIGHRR